MTEITVAPQGATWGRKSITLTWAPHADITAFELARAIHVLSAAPAFVRDAYEALPAEVKRHFEVGS